MTRSACSRSTGNLAIGDEDLEALQLVEHTTDFLEGANLRLEAFWLSPHSFMVTPYSCEISALTGCTMTDLS
jgi:hypothetical protein